VNGQSGYRGEAHLKNLKRLVVGLLAPTALLVFVLAACQPQNQPAAVAAGEVTQAQAQAICSTLAVARNTPDFNMLDQVFDANVTTSDPFSALPMMSLEQLKQFYLGTQSAFPDYSMRFDAIWVAGDHLVAHWTAAGTNKGTFFDIEPTGKNVTISGVLVAKVSGGKITEQANYFDLLSVARQLGAHLSTS
jgi:predicted ester cyclase